MTTWRQGWERRSPLDCSRHFGGECLRDTLLFYTRVVRSFQQSGTGRRPAGSCSGALFMDKVKLFVCMGSVGLLLNAFSFLWAERSQVHFCKVQHKCPQALPWKAQEINEVCVRLGCFFSWFWGFLSMFWGSWRVRGNMCPLTGDKAKAHSEGKKFCFQSHTPPHQEHCRAESLKNFCKTEGESQLTVASPQ